MWEHKLKIGFFFDSIKGIYNWKAIAAMPSCAKKDKACFLLDFSSLFQKVNKISLHKFAPPKFPLVLGRPRDQEDIAASASICLGFKWIIMGLKLGL